MSADNKPKHTPGPWVYRYDRNGDYGYGRFEQSHSKDSSLSDPVVLAVREDWLGHLDRSEEGQANARLIFASWNGRTPASASRPGTNPRPAYCPA